MDNPVIVSTIAGYIDANIPLLLKLSQVSKAFNQVFIGDQVWKRFDVYNVKEGIYRHFIDKIEVKGGQEWEPTDAFSESENKYVWLEWLKRRENQQVELPAAILEDADFIRVAVAYIPTIYLQLDGDYLNDKKIARGAIFNQHPHHMAIASHFSALSPLAHDKEFCLEAVNGPWGEATSGNLICFSEEFHSDLEVLRTAVKWHPKALLLFSEITKEVIDEFVPTEDDFLPIIEGHGGLLPKFIEFYNSPRVLYTALEPEDYETVDYLRGLAENGQFNPETKAALECWMNPELFNELDEDLKANADIVALVLSSPVNSEVLETYDELSDELKSNKNIIAAVLGSLYTVDDFEPMLEHLPEKETQQVLADPYYAKRLVKRNWVLFNFIKAPITKELIQLLVAVEGECAAQVELPKQYLNNAEFLEMGAGIFCNLLDAPEELLTHGMILKLILADDVDPSLLTLPPKFQKDGTLLALLIGIIPDPDMALYQYSQVEGLFNDEAKQDPRVLERIFGILKLFADGEVDTDEIESEPETHAALVKFLKQKSTEKCVKELEASGKLEAGIYDKAMDLLDNLIDIESLSLEEE